VQTCKLAVCAWELSLGRAAGLLRRGGLPGYQCHNHLRYKTAAQRYKTALNSFQQLPSFGHAKASMESSSEFAYVAFLIRSMHSTVHEGVLSRVRHKLQISNGTALAHMCCVLVIGCPQGPFWLVI
jgi:hypothetical protein